MLVTKDIRAFADPDSASCIHLGAVPGLTMLSTPVRFPDPPSPSPENRAGMLDRPRVCGRLWEGEHKEVRRDDQGCSLCVQGVCWSRDALSDVLRLRLQQGVTP